MSILLTGAGTSSVSLIDPATLSPHLWLDPSDLSVNKQVSDGTIAVVVDSPVGYAADKSGNANHHIRATADERPLLRDAGGKQYWQFDGTNGAGGDRLIGPAFSTFITATEFDLLVACSVATLTSNNTGVNVYDNDVVICDEGQYSGLYLRSSGLIGWYTYNAGYTELTDTYIAGQKVVVHVRLSAGTLSLTVNSNTPVTTSFATIGSVASNSHIGGNFGHSIGTDVDLYGLFARKTILSAGNLADMKTYMASKIGISL
jgi:hypothetical protein